jgi:hypothetical protein
LKSEIGNVFLKNKEAKEPGATEFRCLSLALFVYTRNFFSARKDAVQRPFTMTGQTAEHQRA